MYGTSTEGDIQLNLMLCAAMPVPVDGSPGPLRCFLDTQLLQIWPIGGMKLDHRVGVGEFQMESQMTNILLFRLSRMS